MEAELKPIENLHSGEWTVSLRGTLPKVRDANSLISRGASIAEDPDRPIMAVVILTTSSLEESHDEEAPHRAKLKIVEIEEVAFEDRSVVADIVSRTRKARLAIERPLFEEPELTQEEALRRLARTIDDGPYVDPETGEILFPEGGDLP